jgi:hypothetical protein
MGASIKGVSTEGELCFLLFDKLERTGQRKNLEPSAVAKAMADRQIAQIPWG